MAHPTPSEADAALCVHKVWILDDGVVVVHHLRSRQFGSKCLESVVGHKAVQRASDTQGAVRTGAVIVVVHSWLGERFSPGALETMIVIIE